MQCTKHTLHFIGCNSQCSFSPYIVVIHNAFEILACQLLYARETKNNRNIGVLYSAILDLDFLSAEHNFHRLIVDGSDLRVL